MLFPNIPIRQKLIRMIMLICSIVVVLICCAYVVFEIITSKNNIKENERILGNIIASNSSAALAFDNPADANEILSALNANKHIVAACLYDKSGKLFARYPAGVSNAELPVKPKAFGYRFENGSVAGFQPVMQKNELLGTLYIQSDMGAIYARLRMIILTAAMLIIATLIIAYLLSNLLEKTISDPIIALEETARVVTKEQNYAIRAVKAGHDEVGALTDAFNQMLTQIEKQNHEIRLAQEASANLAAIVESSEDAIIGQNMNGLITSWNKSAQRMFGYTAEEMIGQPVFRLIPDNLLNDATAMLDKLNKGEHIDTFETQWRTKANLLTYVSVSVSHVHDVDGNIIGLSEIVRDITEKKQEEIRKNDFIAIVSHELKTPLTSLRSYIQVLLGIAKKDDQNGFRINALTRAEVQVKKMANMVQDFLNLARIENGKIQLNKEHFELQPMMKELVAEAQFLTSNHNITFEACEGIKVFADKEKISHVLINLLSNAIKYSPKGGNIKISCQPEEDKVRIAVSDEGVGIHPEDQKKLFDRFYRVKNEKVKTVSGFGIGLYLVSEIVKSHNSKIHLNSTEGQGSTFYFDLDAG